MLSYPDFKEKTIIISFSTEGQKLSFKNDNLIIKDKEDKILLQATCHKILAVWIVGNITISSGLMERSKKFGFPIYLLSINFRLIGLWNAATEGNFLLRQKQYAYKDWSIARFLVHNKIENQLANLMSIRKKTISCRNAIASLRQYQNQLPQATEQKEILGLEGIASKLYFEQWFNTVDWRGRKPRLKPDPINVLLDMGYTFLFYLVENMLQLYGFDVYKGVYHRNFYQRKSLVCDLQEPFRCIIDRIVKNAFGLGQVNEEDFVIERGAYKLKYEKNKAYSKWLMKELLGYKSEIFLYCQQYYRCFIQQKPINDYPQFLIKQ
ncbi:MAG TPA: type V CRISPR-associated endonuclease Cas1 [Edaphocola sp.]|nr:type V CRISPR-associated endonuclease Cas1 [Edaphocola sp.]